MAKRPMEEFSLFWTMMVYKGMPRYGLPELFIPPSIPLGRHCNLLKPGRGLHSVSSLGLLYVSPNRVTIYWGFAAINIESLTADNWQKNSYFFG